MPHSVVILDLSAGEARINGTPVGVRARPGGTLAFGDQVLRPLRFGERWRLLAEIGDGLRVGASVLAHSATTEPHGSVVDDAAVDPVIEQILALHLAGARPERAVPGFARQLADLVDAGWTPRDVFDADADLIDLIAEASCAGDGWTSIVLAADPPAPRSLPEVLRLLEDDLQRRLTTTTDGPEEGHLADHADRTEPIVGNRITEPEGNTNTAQLLPPRHIPHRSAAASMLDVAAAGRRAGSEPRTVDATPPASSTAAEVRLSSEPVPPTNPLRADDATPPANSAPRTSSASPRLIAADAVAAPPPEGRSSTAAEARLSSEPVPPTNPFHASSPLFRGDDPDVWSWPPPMRDISDRLNMASSPAGRTDQSATVLGGGSHSPAADTTPTAVRADPTARRAWPLTPPDPAAGPAPDVFDLADQVAALLDDESDLRGLRR